MEWNESTLFAAWTGKRAETLADLSWSALIRNGEQSCLAKKVNELEASEFDHLHDVCNNVDRILWRYWDPLAINKLSVCRNEYHEFAWEISCAASVGSSAQVVAELYALERYYFNVERGDAIFRASMVTDKLYEAIGICEAS